MSFKKLVAISLLLATPALAQAPKQAVQQSGNVTAGPCGPTKVAVEPPCPNDTTIGVDSGVEKLRTMALVFAE